MRILALFDDGNGSVKKALPDHDVVSVGIGNADVVMDLSDLSNIKKLVDMHKKEPFDLLMASPPCESWSFATAGDNGNAYRDKTSLALRTFQNWKNTRMCQFVDWLSVTRLKFRLSIPDI